MIYIIIILAIVFAVCASVSAYHVDKTDSKKSKVLCLTFLTLFVISCVSFIPTYNYDCMNTKIDVRDITVRIHYIDGSTQDYVFNNVRERYPQVYHYKGDYSIMVEEYKFIGGYRYDILQEKYHEVTIDEFYRSWNRKR